MSQFKGSNGKWKTVSLFLEHEYNYEEAVLTFKDDHYVTKGKTFLSARKLFVALEDPTGYTFAQEHLGGYAHWKTFVSSPAISPHVAEWQEELEVKIRSGAIKGIVQDAVSESRSNITSAKWLADKGWIKDDPKRTKTSKKQEAAQRTLIKDDLHADAERLGIPLN